MGKPEVERLDASKEATILRAGWHQIRVNEDSLAKLKSLDAVGRAHAVWRLMRPIPKKAHKAKYGDVRGKPPAGQHGNDCDALCDAVMGEV